jgi:zinc protease
MILRRLGFPFISLTLLLIASVTPGWALDVKVSKYVLDNGMQVIVVPDRRSQVVTHSVWYRVGAADEVSGKTGLAHFLEHLLFKGTKTFPQGEFDRIIDINGARSNAFTTQDATVYYQQTTSDRLPMMMELEADRMQNIVLTDENVRPELDVVREERRMRTENEPQALLREQAEAALFTAHPYGRPTIGWMNEVAQLTKDDALAFYKKYYTPANAILVVGGDVEPDQVLTLAKKYYGGLKNTFEPSPRARTAEPEPLVERRLTMRDARVSSPSFSRVYLSPAVTDKTEIDVLSLQFFAHILGSGAKSLLYRKLVVEQQLASYAGAAVDDGGRDYGKFYLYAAPNPGVDIAKLETAMDEILRDFIKTGVTQQDLDKVRKQALAEQVYSLDDQFQMVTAVGSAIINDEPPESAFDTEIWKAVTPETVAAAAKAYLLPRRSVTSILLPEDAQ